MADLFSIEPLGEARGGLPLLVQARGAVDLVDALGELRPLIEARLPSCAGVLLRGFQVGDAERFRAFAGGFGHALLNYEFGSTPRSNVTRGVYTSTEYPPHQHIPLHNEQAYTREWPLKIWFYCVQAAASGGETPIADSRAIYRDVGAAIRTRFEERGLMYVRNFGNGLDVAWEQVFNSDDREVVEAYCRAHRIDCQWKDDGELRTRQVCQATARHPFTGDLVWFNQAHLFHVSNLPAEVRESLLEIVDEEDLPRNVYYGDGSPIETSLLDDVRGVLEEAKVSFPWYSGDVLMLDNMLAAHARAPFSGPRKVVVAMAQGHGS
ncbi:TauD/TfdA family dioxygenase [Pseudomonas citronellolis]|uniref:TauD/TfdA family dioxygenase n=1 Tax=Pseudomonas citronellolis TaxID=53408 RepID=UPI0023E3E707|nr:TauD/TfdA family dioxygenase [Pseudomonas citronellolis]MDF3932681.1 TauD/TfdA family dioxygenase [Pseudomonas citronellolis]